jgi:N-acetyl-gamma-glutamylphosphate reductase
MNGITPSQAIGPFAAPCLTPNEKGKQNYKWQQLINGNLVTADAVGERIRLEGRMIADLEAALDRHYAGAKWVKVVKVDPAAKDQRIDAPALNDTNLMELRVYGSEKHRAAVLVARLDNLGKGASGAAVQNIGLMLGVET